MVDKDAILRFLFVGFVSTVHAENYKRFGVWIGIVV